MRKHLPSLCTPSQCYPWPIELTDYSPVPTRRYVRTEELPFLQIVTNLLQNSARFTKRGFLLVRLESCPSEHLPEFESVSITVADTGMGISDAVRQSLYQRCESALEASIRDTSARELLACVHPPSPHRSQTRRHPAASDWACTS